MASAAGPDQGSSGYRRFSRTRTARSSSWPGVRARQAASATLRTKLGVLLPSDDQRSQSRRTASVLAESIIGSIRQKLLEEI